MKFGGKIIFFIAMNVFLEKIQNALIFIKIKNLQKELHHSVRQWLFYIWLTFVHTK